MADFDGFLVSLPSPSSSDAETHAPIVDGALQTSKPFASSDSAFFVPAIGSAVTIVNPQGGMGAMKGQYIASEDLRIILPPFMDTVTNQFVTVGDVVTLTIKKPDNTLLAPAPTALRDGDTNFWVATIPKASFQAGEWLIKADSDAADTLSQFVSLVWGDYLDDMHQASLGRWKVENNQLTLYKEDGVTVLRTFDLKDGDGLPSSSQVFERAPV